MEIGIIGVVGLFFILAAIGWPVKSTLNDGK